MLEKILELDPEVLFIGHGEPLKKLRTFVSYFFNSNKQAKKKGRGQKPTSLS
jgi:hypothetical protein